MTYINFLHVIAREDSGIVVEFSCPPVAVFLVDGNAVARVKRQIAGFL